MDIINEIEDITVSSSSECVPEDCGDSGYVQCTWMTPILIAAPSSSEEYYSQLQYHGQKYCVSIEVPKACCYTG
ncbi:unnamed protein product [Leptidea sinapis]|uniref:Uncharacterized protein n=1 Tax=Leptidea sinapis TaxID=189913 RepID=A0A5E4R7Z9_9NEOP|nr:unnamed protein product [Leptidea sinapis]